MRGLQTPFARRRPPLAHQAALFRPADAKPDGRKRWREVGARARGWSRAGVRPGVTTAARGIVDRTETVKTVKRPFFFCALSLLLSLLVCRLSFCLPLTSGGRFKHQAQTRTGQRFVRNVGCALLLFLSLPLFPLLPSLFLFCLSSSVFPFAIHPRFNSKHRHNNKHSCRPRPCSPHAPHPRRAPGNG